MLAVGVGQHSAADRPRRTARPGTRTLVDDLPPDIGRQPGSRHVAEQRSNCTARGNRDERFAPTLVRRRRPPRRAATRGRSAMEGGDEHGRCEEALLSNSSLESRIERRERQRVWRLLDRLKRVVSAEPHYPTRLDERCASERAATHGAGQRRWLRTTRPGSHTLILFVESQIASVAS
jgi:hypothetical protein